MPTEPPATAGRRYSKFLRRYLASLSLYDFVFAYAVYNALFNIRGLSVFEISVLLAWWSLTAIFFEVPSGALADRWSRKKMLVLAPLIKALCFAIWFLAEGSFYIYGLGFLFWSVSESLVSGTAEALLYDELTAYGRIADYEKALSRRKFWYHVALAVSMVSGGVIAHFSLNLVLLLSVIPLVISALFAWGIAESPKAGTTGNVRYFGYIGLAFREVKSNGILLRLLIYAFGISLFAELEEFDQLYFRLANLPIIAFGIVGFIGSMLNALGSLQAHRLRGYDWIFHIVPFLSAGLLLAVGLRPGVLKIGLLLLSYFFSSPLNVLIDSRIQHSIGSRGRATVSSVAALFMNLFGILVTLVFGILSRIWNLQAIYFASAVMLTILGVWSLKNRTIFSRGNKGTEARG